ncbi:MAG TPA: hypothetical protein VEV87_06435, partial [Chitinophagaceae bacterium]|nr:hypothetical protein [Chitinophagaceae bacterium]
NYPLLAWDGKGTRLAVMYWKEGKIRLFVYDLVGKFKRINTQLPQFEQIQSMQFMLDANTLLFSGVRKGQSDVYVYKIDKENVDQITNDVYDDLDASFVAFPNKTGIIYASNRPSVDAPTGDTVLPNNKYNVFLVDNWANNEFKNTSQLTFLKFGDARFPTQYNTSHFTFISDENGIGNRYAGFFQTDRAGVDTIFRVGDLFLRNPEFKELDSILKLYDQAEPDSMFVVSITSDSAYVFPITNYQSSVKETKIAGDLGQVSEVRQEGDLKFLYKLRVDENALRKRNVTARPTDFRKKTMMEAQLESGQAIQFEPSDSDTSRNKDDFFESEFDKEKRDSARVGRVVQAEEEVPETVLSRARLFDYRLKFSIDNFSGNLFNNDVLVTRYEPYTGALPISLTSSGAFNGMLKASVFDLFEDIRFTGAIRLPFFNGQGSSVAVGTGGSSVFVANNSSLFDGGGEWYSRLDYLKKRFDYSLLYYRKTEVGSVQLNGGAIVGGKSYTNLYQGIVKYPFDRVRSIKMMFGVRTDKLVLRPGDDPRFDTIILKAGDQNKQTYGLVRMEYVYDNVIQKSLNILNGLRYKAYIDWAGQINEVAGSDGSATFNAGFDARYYYPIFRNFIWAFRGAGDFSWGNKKIIYYLGGVDGWLFPEYNMNPRPQDPDYAYQSLAVNLRGFNQNTANGNNAVILNSEFRFPVFTTLFNKPINNAFLRNFQLTQFIDLGTAWNGQYGDLERPSVSYGNPPVSVVIQAGGIGPFAGGYGFGARSTLLGYFLRIDAGWQMNGFFSGKPVWHFAMGVDF